MSVDRDTVRRVAHLARIAVAESELEGLRGELNAILAFVEQLAEVEIEGVEPMTSVTPMTLKMRKDEVTDGDVSWRRCSPDFRCSRCRCGPKTMSKTAALLRQWAWRPSQIRFFVTIQKLDDRSHLAHASASTRGAA